MAVVVVDTVLDVVVVSVVVVVVVSVLVVVVLVEVVVVVVVVVEVVVVVLVVVVVNSVVVEGRTTPYTVALISMVVSVHAVLYRWHSPLPKCVIALHLALFTHKLLHSSTLLPVAEDNNTSPLFSSHLE